MDTNQHNPSIPKALVLVFSHLRHDGRVTRQINWLKKHFSLTVVCFSKIEVDQPVSFLELKQTTPTLSQKLALGLLLLLKFHKKAYSKLHRYYYIVPLLKPENFSLIVANDVETLPLAFKIKSNSTKVILDAHEYAPRHFENNLIWRIFFQPLNRSLCENFIPKVDGMMTVGQGLADEYKKEFNVSPIIITNAPYFQSLQPYPVKDNIRLIHHGIANPSRKIEWMLELMDYLDDRFTLDLILMVSPFASKKTKAYINNIEHLAAKCPKITIHPSVKSTEIVNAIHQYDIGVFLVPPVNFNYANTLPNKFFEFIQARLAIAIGPTSSMADIVKKYDLGVVAEKFSPKSLADSLNKLTKENIERFKNNSTLAAQQLNADQNEILFDNYVNKIIHGQRDK